MSSEVPKMRAVYQDAYGGVETFKLGDLPRPSPAKGEVLIKVRAAAVNPVDIKRSDFMKGEAFPLVAGYDVAGVIAELGSRDLLGFKVGDKVFAEVTGGAGKPKNNGSVAEFCVVKANLVGKMPEGASFVDMAATPVAVGTAIQAFDILELSEGNRIFISGGAGGVGVHAIQIAKSVYGASQVATTASAGKIDFVKQWGADVVVDYKSEDAGEVLKGWADVVLDCTYEGSMCKKIAKDGGKVCSIIQFDHEDVIPVILDATGELMNKISKYFAEKKFKVVVEKVYALEDGIKAIEHVAGGRSMGKVVIEVIE